MRVLTVGNMYPPHHLGGYELVWQACVRELREHGHTVRVLTTDHREEDARSMPEEQDVHRELRWYWRDHDFPRLGPRARLRVERHNARVLAEHLRAYRPDAVAWFAMGGMSLSLMEQVRRAGLPALAVACDDWVSYAPKVDAWTRMWASRARLAAPFARLTGLITSVDLGQVASYAFLSDALRRRAALTQPALADAEVVHRGPDAELFPPAPEREWRWRLLYAGRVEPRKGVDSAIRALVVLPVSATLAIDGPAEEGYLEELRSLAEELGVAERIEFRRTARERLASAYAESDVVVFPVRWEEPWGLVPLEAMSVGRPVVATGLGGSGEYLDHERNCLLYEPPEDPGRLASAVMRLAEEPDLRQRLRAGGSETVAALTRRSFEARVREMLAELAS